MKTLDVAAAHPYVALGVQLTQQLLLRPVVKLGVGGKGQPEIRTLGTKGNNA